ncbi:hypothetical protein Dimus_021966 [Dionaea muscipula]
MRSGEGLCGAAGELITWQNQEGTVKNLVLRVVLPSRALRAMLAGRAKEEQGKDLVLQVVLLAVHWVVRSGRAEEEGKDLVLQWAEPRRNRGSTWSSGWSLQVVHPGCAAGLSQGGTREGPGPPGGPPELCTGLSDRLSQGGTREGPSPPDGPPGRAPGRVRRPIQGGTGEAPGPPGGPSGCALRLSQGGTREGPGPPGGSCEKHDSGFPYRG